MFRQWRRAEICVSQLRTGKIHNIILSSSNTQYLLKLQSMLPSNCPKYTQRHHACKVFQLDLTQFWQNISQMSQFWLRRHGWQGMSSFSSHHHNIVPHQGSIPGHWRRARNIRVELLLQRHHRLSLLRDGGHHHHQQDLLRQDLRQGQPQQLRDGRGEWYPVQHQHEVQWYWMRCQERGTWNIHKPGV